MTTTENTTASVFTTKGKLEKLLAAIKVEQFNNGGNTYYNGINHGLFMAEQFIRTWFQDDLAAPAAEPVNDWSNVPASERPEVVLDSQKGWGEMFPGNKINFVKEAHAA